MPNRVLLLAAGFSKNWNGFLASEINDYLVGQPEIDAATKAMLTGPGSKGFEEVLNVLQMQPSATLKGFEVALMRCYDLMNTAFAKMTDFNFSSDVEFLVTKFLARFDAIFTLNQDALLEIHYLGSSPELLSEGRFDGCAIPGMRKDTGHPLDKVGTWRPGDSTPEISRRIQPYIKLHGSSNWRSDAGSLLVVGGQKTSAIAQEPVLVWGMTTFEHFLSMKDTRLIVVGYGFRDHHINSAILRAATISKLKMSVIGPQGFDGINWQVHGGAIPAKSQLYQDFEPYFGGHSRRHLSSTFSGKDWAEFTKVMEFLD